MGKRTSLEEDFQKALIATKVRKSEKGNYFATCGACFHEQIAKPKRGQKYPVMVLHGYNRPGVGYIIGQCPGTNLPPYELSSEATELMLSYAMSHLEGLQAKLDKLRDPKLKKLTIVLSEYIIEGFRHKEIKREVIIDPSYVPDRGGDRTFEEHRKSQVLRAEADIRFVKGDIDSLQNKLADWKFAPEKLIPAKKGESKAATERKAIRSSREQKWEDEIQSKNAISEEVLGKYPEFVEWLKSMKSFYTNRFSSIHDEIVSRIGFSRDTAKDYGTRRDNAKSALSELRSNATDYNNPWTSRPKPKIQVKIPRGK